MIDFDNLSDMIEFTGQPWVITYYKWRGEQMSADRKTAKEVLLDVIAQNSKKIAELQEENTQCQAAVKIIDGINPQPVIDKLVPSDSDFGVKYNVVLFRDGRRDTCTCRDFAIRRQGQTPCKHILRNRAAYAYLY